MKRGRLMLIIGAGLFFSACIILVEKTRTARLRDRLLAHSSATKVEALLEIYRENRHLSDDLLRVVAGDLGTSDVLVRETAEVILWKAKPRRDAFREALPVPQPGDEDLRKRVRRLLQ